MRALLRALVYAVTAPTSDLMQRIHQLREGVAPGFTREHGVKRLVWFEPHATMERAILREKRIKPWLRVWKLELIERGGLGWRDLAEALGFAPLEPTGSPLSREHRCYNLPEVAI